MSELPHADISDKDKIIAIPKGEKFDPSSYMSEDDIKKHLGIFEDGVVKFQSSESYKQAIDEFGSIIGHTIDGTFVLPKSIAEKAIAASNGDPRILEQLLGFGNGYLGNKPILINIQTPSNIRIPS